MKTILSVILLVLFLYSCGTVKTRSHGRTSKVEVKSTEKLAKV